MPKATPISIEAAFTQLRFLANRTPETSDEEAEGAFAMLSEYRDGAVLSGIMRVIAIGSAIQTEMRLFSWSKGKRP